MTAPAVTSPVHGSGMLAATSAVAKRSLLRYLRTPQMWFISAVQGVVFMLIFRYAFGGAISSGGMSYVDYLVPGVVTVGVLFSGGTSAVGVAEDSTSGFFDRLRSMPMPHSAILVGRVLADTVLVAWCLVVCVAVAFAIGFRVHTDAASAFLALMLIVLFGMAFVWVFIALGMLSAGNPQAAQGLGFLVLPLSFASSAFVPVGTMPGWLETIADNQPVTIVINAVRTLTQGSSAEALLAHGTAYYVWGSLLWTTLITAVFATIAIGRLRTR